MNIRNYWATGLVAGVMTLGTAQAQSDSGLSYSFIEGGVSVIDLDAGSFDEDETGFDVRASLDLAGGVYLHGSWDRWNIEIGPFDLDTDLYKIGAGYRHSVAARTDVFVEASYAALEIGSLDDDGFRADVGLRSALGERFEGRVFAGLQTDGGNPDGLLGADLLFKLTPTVGINLAAETYEFDTNLFRANLRLSF